MYTGGKQENREPTAQPGLGALTEEVVALSEEALGRLSGALLRPSEGTPTPAAPVPANRLDQIAGQLQDARANLRALLKLVEQELAAKL